MTPFFYGLHVVWYIDVGAVVKVPRCEDGRCQFFRLVLTNAGIGVTNVLRGGKWGGKALDRKMERGRIQRRWTGASHPGPSGKASRDLTKTEECSRLYVTR